MPVKLSQPMNQELTNQVAMILDPEGVPVAKDTQDLHSSSEY